MNASEPLGTRVADGYHPIPEAKLETMPLMTDTPPDRLSNNPRSPFYDAALLERGIGVRLNGVDRTNVEEYCVSEGWARLAVGKTTDRFGNPLAMKVNGTVEPYFRSGTPDAKPNGT